MVRKIFAENPARTKSIRITSLIKFSHDGIASTLSLMRKKQIVPETLQPCLRTGGQPMRLGLRRRERVPRLWRNPFGLNKARRRRRGCRSLAALKGNGLRAFGRRFHVVLDLLV